MSEINKSIYIQQISDAYQAGLENNNDKKNQIISDAYINLPNDCKNYININNTNNKSQFISSNDVSFNSTNNIFTKYKDDIEFTNSITEKILADERDYFTNKYSVQVYDYLLKKREEIYEIQDNLLASISFDGVITTNSNDYITINGNSYNLNSLSDKIVDRVNQTKDQTISEVYEKIKDYLPNTDIELINRKVEYRSMEHDKLKWINSIMNIVYYSLLITLFIILFSTDNLYFTDRFLLYLFLILAPYLFPYFYNLIKKTFNLFKNPISELHGPKNAFLDTSVNKPDIGAHDI